MITSGAGAPIGDRTVHPMTDLSARADDLRERNLR
jgi:hypothetical protein